MAKVVTGRNATFQYWQTLLTNRTKRNRAGEMIVQGVRPINLALEAGFEVRAVLATQGKRSTWAEGILRSSKAQIYYVAPELLEELTEKEAAELVLVVAIPEDELARLGADPAGLWVAMDRPTSPGNIGSIVRSLDALGGSGMLVSGHAADPYDPKSMRASIGSMFFVPTVRVAGPKDVVAWSGQLREQGVPVTIVGTDETGTADLWDLDLTGPVIIVAGNETTGMGKTWLEVCDVVARIPMGGHASSLNVANATSIMLAEAARQRRR